MAVKTASSKPQLFVLPSERDLPEKEQGAILAKPLSKLVLIDIIGDQEDIEKVKLTGKMIEGLLRESVIEIRNFEIDGKLRPVVKDIDVIVDAISMVEDIDDFNAVIEFVSGLNVLTEEEKKN